MDDGNTSPASEDHSPETIEWGPGKTARGRARPLSSRRRTKPQRSCNLCRKRKLRCDRQHPCTNCLRRELGASCTYPTENEPLPAARARNFPTSVQDRVQHLEKLLMDMVHNRVDQTFQDSQDSQDCIQESALSCQATPIQAPSRLGTAPDPPPSIAQMPDGGSIASPESVALANGTDATVSPSASDCGAMHRTPTGTSYVSSSHWAAVLDDIAVLKMHFERDEKEEEQIFQQEDDTSPSVSEPSPSNHVGPQLLYGSTKVATKEELLSSIPARPVVDQLVSGYFASFEMSPAFLHSLQFLQEYDEFWEHPERAPVIWLGRLFAIMCLATQFQRYKLDNTTTSVFPDLSREEQDRQLQCTAETLRTKVVQCLVLADYIKGGPGVIETLMFYFSTELFFHQDAEVGVWLLLGTIIQLAMRMGYHRDSKHFPASESSSSSLSPFAGEMQRRVWATIVESDIALAVQMGLPRIIQPSETDTDEPRNLEDCDFSVSTVELPPSRPEIDQTPMLFRLVKARLFGVIGRIWDLNNIRSRPSTYAEAMEMGRQLQTAYVSIPACFQWRSKTQCMVDPPKTVVQKVALQLIYHMARIILMWKYFGSAAKNNNNSSSSSSNNNNNKIHAQKECLDASLKLLEFQCILHEKMEPFGQLYQERWKVYSLVNHNFLLGASVLCFYLKDRSHDRANEDEEGTMEDTVRAALRRSRDIWMRSSSFSKEARKAAKAVNIVLGTEDQDKINLINAQAQSQDASIAEAAVDMTTATTITTPSFSPSASAVSSDFMASFRPSMNDWAEMTIPFPTLHSATAWDNWSATPVELAQATTALTSPRPTLSGTGRGSQKSNESIDPISGISFQSLAWTG